MFTKISKNTFISFIVLGLLGNILNSSFATAQSNFCGTNFVSLANESEGYDGTLYLVYVDFRRGQETVNPSACGREYWISTNPNNQFYGVRFVYIVNGARKRVDEKLYYESADGRLFIFRDADEARLLDPFASDLGLLSNQPNTQSSNTPNQAQNPQNQDLQELSQQQTITPFFEKPFQGDFQMWNPFDHHFPLQFEHYDGLIVNFRGDRLPSGQGGYDGHEGYDWQMPLGTPILAVADGMVSFASNTRSFYCPVLRSQVSDVIVTLSHTASNGSLIESRYQHLSQVFVRNGQVVQSGQRIGLSGSSGCATGPHLHFGVYALTNRQSVPIDPYGWQGSYPDPWANHPSGATSIWLWLPGHTPSL